jgi:hypothetical protein
MSEAIGRTKQTAQFTSSPLPDSAKLPQASTPQESAALWTKPTPGQKKAPTAKEQKNVPRQINNQASFITLILRNSTKNHELRSFYIYLVFYPFYPFSRSRDPPSRSGKGSS